MVTWGAGIPSLPPATCRAFSVKGQPVWSPSGAAVWSEGRTRFSTLNSRQSAAPSPLPGPLTPAGQTPRRIRLLLRFHSLNFLHYHFRVFTVFMQNSSWRRPGRTQVTRKKNKSSEDCVLMKLIVAILEKKKGAQYLVIIRWKFHIFTWDYCLISW